MAQRCHRACQPDAFPRSTGCARPRRSGSARVHGSPSKRLCAHLWASLPAAFPWRGRNSPMQPPSADPADSGRILRNAEPVSRQLIAQVCSSALCSRYAGTVASVTSPLERLPAPCAPGGRPELPQPCAPVSPVASRTAMVGQPATYPAGAIANTAEPAAGVAARAGELVDAPLAAMDCTAASAAVDWFTGVQGGHAFPTRLSADL
jgi:hypothetical protein